MKALTVRQPWASLIVAGIKRVENRTWRTTHRGVLLIHAGKRFDVNGPDVDRGSLDFSAIIGRVEVVDCLTLREYVKRYGRDEYAVGPWCWVLANPRRSVRPVRCAGQQSLWDANVTQLRREARGQPGLF